MQQGLRMCKHEAVMWVELMRLELLYIQRLRVRREVLGLDVPLEGKGGKESVDASRGGNGEAGDEGAESEVAVNAVLTGAVAGIVLRQAVAALPTSLDLRRRLIEVLGDFSFPGTGQLLQEVYASIERDFTKEPEAWDILARRHLSPASTASPPAQVEEGGSKRAKKASKDGKSEGKVDGGMALADAKAHAAVVSVYNEAVQAVHTEHMFDLFSTYLEEHLEATLRSLAEAGGQESGQPSTSSAATSAAGSKKRSRGGVGASKEGPATGDAAAAAGAELLTLYGKAHATGCASAALYLRWVGWARRLGQDKMAGAASRQACSRHPSNPEVWACRLSLEAVRQPPAVPELLTTLGSALSSMPSVGGPAALGLWLQVLDAILKGGKDHADGEGEGGSGKDLKKLVDMLEVATIKLPSTSGRNDKEGMGVVVAAFLTRIRCGPLSMFFGAKSTRKFREAFITTCAIPLSHSIIFLHLPSHTQHSTLQGTAWDPGGPELHPTILPPHGPRGGVLSHGHRHPPGTVSAPATGGRS